jgi:hypothetical protein
MFLDLLRQIVGEASERFLEPLAQVIIIAQHEAHGEFFDIAPAALPGVQELLRVCLRPGETGEKTEAEQVEVARGRMTSSVGRPPSICLNAQ